MNNEADLLPDDYQEEIYENFADYFEAFQHGLTDLLWLAAISSLLIFAAVAPWVWLIRK